MNRCAIGMLLTCLAVTKACGDTNSCSISFARQGNHAQLQWPSQTNECFQIERRTNLVVGGAWQTLATNWLATGSQSAFVHSNALNSSAGFYRVTRVPFAFEWSGTNFTYTDTGRSFTGIMLKPAGNGPFPAVIINHGAGGTANGYSLMKARELVTWGLVCIGPTLTHVANGETNAPNMGNCPENIARATACANVLASLPYGDTKRLALFGHSMGAFATIGDAAALGNRIRAAAITAGGIIPDSAGTNNAAPTVTEADPVRTPFVMFHCDGDPVVPYVREQLFQQLLTTNGVLYQHFLYSSNSIPNQSNWHNIHQDAAINANVLTNTYQWFQARGVLQ
jgi:dienelactone hydrolase